MHTSHPVISHIVLVFAVREAEPVVGHVDVPDTVLGSLTGSVSLNFGQPLNSSPLYTRGKSLKVNHLSEMVSLVYCGADWEAPGAAARAARVCCF